MGVRGRIGEFQPFAELNRGPATIVYKAYQESLSRVVLLKVLRPSFTHMSDIVEQFEEEARLVAKIQHPNVVTIYSYGRDDDRSYFVTEFVEGVDLATLLSEAPPLPLGLATYVLREVGKGLKAAHRQEILHRDIKPANIMIGYEGQVKLTDFGMASIVRASDETGDVRGTPGYMAPEQLAEDTATQASDVFALGATAYEMIAGRKAFPGETLSDSIDAVLNEDPLPALAFVRSIPAPLKEILARLLAKDPGDRWQDADVIVEAIDDFREDHSLTAGAEELAAYLENPDAYTEDEPSAAPAQERPIDRPETGSHPEQEEIAEAQRMPDASRTAVMAAAIVLLAAAGYFLMVEDRGTRTSVTLQGRTVVLPESLRYMDPMAGSRSLPFLPVVDTQANRVQDVESPGGDGPVRSRERARVVQRSEGDSTGFFMVETAPGAVIFVDGDSMGQTPLEEAIRVAPGRHPFAIQHQDFPEYRDSITVVANEQTSIDVSLEALLGSLDIRVSPWAEVEIDGVVRDTTPLVEPFMLEPGRHVVTLRHPDYGERDTLLQVAAGEAHRIEFSFQQSID